MKRYICVIAFFMLICNQVTEAQEAEWDENVVTQRSYAYFCDSIIKNDAELVSYKISFSGIANEEPSSVDNIATCLGLVDSIDTNNYLLFVKELEDIDEQERAKTHSRIKLKIEAPLSPIRKPETNKFPYLQICAPLMYKGSIYQEYVIVYGMKYISFSVKIDPLSLRPSNYYRLDLEAGSISKEES